MAGFPAGNVVATLEELLVNEEDTEPEDISSLKGKILVEALEDMDSFVQYSV